MLLFCVMKSYNHPICEYSKQKIYKLLTFIMETNNFAQELDPVVHLDVRICGQIVRPIPFSVDCLHDEYVLVELRVEIHKYLFTLLQVDGAFLAGHLIVFKIFQYGLTRPRNNGRSRGRIQDKVATSPLLINKKSRI